MSGISFTQSNLVQHDAWQTGDSVVAGNYSLGALDIAKPPLGVQLHAATYSLGTPSFATPPVGGHVFALQVGSYSLGSPTSSADTIHQNHRLYTLAYTLVPVYSKPVISQNHQFSTNPLNLGSLDFASPRLQIVNVLGASEYALSALAFENPPNASIIGHSLKAIEWSIDRLRFGFPRLVQTIVTSKMPPLYLSRLDNAVSILDGFLNRILASVPHASTIPPEFKGSNLKKTIDDVRHAIASFRDAAPELIRDAAMGQPMANILTLAYQTNANFEGVDVARRFLMQQEITSDYDRAVISGCLIMCLALESRLITGLSFKSREDARTMISRVRVMFDDAKELGIDDIDAGIYRAFNVMGGSLVNYLATRELQLPRIVNYSVATVMPTLALANLIYGDASRCDEIQDENRIIHPGFSPLTLQILSN